MALLLLDPFIIGNLIRQRQELGHDHHDEVWDGLYIVPPVYDNEHQDVRWELAYVLTASIKQAGLGRVLPGVNVSDREDWEQNYRCPDVVVFLTNTKALCRDTHCFGGPDFLAEVITQNDYSRSKLDFYASVGVREMLMVDRYPWAIELYRLINGNLVMVGKSTLDDPLILISEVLPLTFQLVPGDDRPMIKIVHADGVQTWSA